MIFGSLGGLSPVPIVCTLPVAKFTMLALYDLQLNIAMEGVPNNASAADNTTDARRPTFSLDDVDNALAHVTSTKYSQQMPISFLSAALEAKSYQLSFCAYNSGRTIGGAVWDIRHGATSILYAVDVNLKKEVVLNGAALDTFPQAPELLIVEGGCAARKAIRSKKRAKAGESDSKSSVIRATGGASAGADDGELCTLVDETLRNMGNVLIPCESCSRVLEALQLLARHWIDDRKALDHLVFLSPMSFNLLELARSQLEWMTDSLSERFYNGKPNPFELPPVKIATSIRELEKLYPGPKVVLATDASLQCGTGKELLLRWGGNPLNRIVMLDVPDVGSIAAEVLDKSRSPPVVLDVSQPQRVELVGEELAAFVAEQEEKRRRREEASQMRLRQSELAALSSSEVEDNEGAAEVKTDDDDAMQTDEKNQTPEKSKKSSHGDSMDVDDTTGTPAATPGKSRRGQASRLAKFAKPLFPMFETTHQILPSDEYGHAIYDLQLRLEEAPQGTSSTAALSAATTNNTTTKPAEEETEPEALPFKIMSRRGKVQFTCDFKSVPLGGRADLRAVKAVVMKLQPARVLALRGTSGDCEAVQSALGQLTTVGLSSENSYAPTNGESVEFSVRTDRVNLLIPSALLPAAEKKLVAANVGSVVLSAVNGTAQEVARSTSGAGAGIRKVRLMSTAADTAEAALAAEKEELGEGEDGAEQEADEFGFSTMSDDPLSSGALPEHGDCVAVSLGEVSLNALVAALQEAGIATESMTASSADGSVGTVLVCEKQVMVRRSGENDFSIEGPPVAAYWAVRKVLYAHFAFLQQ